MQTLIAGDGVKDEGGGGQVCNTDEINKNYIIGVLTGCPHLTGQNMGRGLAVINKNIRCKCNEQFGHFYVKNVNLF